MFLLTFFVALLFTAANIKHVTVTPKPAIIQDMLGFLSAL
jgi:hypothetical protein